MCERILEIDTQFQNAHTNLVELLSTLFPLIKVLDTFYVGNIDPCINYTLNTKLLFFKHVLLMPL